MKSDSKLTTIASPARRGFIRSLAVAGGAAALAPLVSHAQHNPLCFKHASNWLAKRWSFEATGATMFYYVTPFLWPTQVLGPKEALDQVGAVVWASYQFPCYGRDLMSVVVRQPMEGGQLVPISSFLVEVEEVTFGPPVAHEGAGDVPMPLPAFVPDTIPEPTGPMPTFSLIGRIVNRDPNLPSPFGEIVGRTMSLSSAFDREGPTTNFYLLGGAAAGSHATLVRKATGSLRCHGFRR